MSCFSVVLWCYGVDCELLWGCCLSGRSRSMSLCRQRNKMPAEVGMGSLGNREETWWLQVYWNLSPTDINAKQQMPKNLLRSKTSLWNKEGAIRSAQQLGASVSLELWTPFQWKLHNDLLLLPIWQWRKPHFSPSVKHYLHYTLDSYVALWLQNEEIWVQISLCKASWILFYSMIKW